MRPWRASHSWLIVVFFLSSCLSVIQLQFSLFFYQRWICIPYLFSSSPSFFLFSEWLLPRSQRCWPGTWGTSWSPRTRSCVTSATWRLWPTCTRAWSGSPPASRPSSPPCRKHRVSEVSEGWGGHCRENWQDSMPTCLKTMTWKDSCIFRRLTI